MNTRRASIIPLLLILVGGLCLLPLERHLQRMSPVYSPGRAELLAQAGRGVILATLGGWRTLAADFIWLKANLSWEKEDLPTTRAWLDLVVAVDERPDYFWLNGARIIAYDMPVWRLRGQGEILVALAERYRNEQAQAALDFLARGIALRGPAPELYAEMAGIHHRARRDIQSAAMYYRKAAECPNAPFYPARIYAELLIAMGKRHEARDWLRQLLPTLSAENPEARRDVVAERLAALEGELQEHP